MTSFIDNIDKDGLESVFDDLHDTFARDIKFIKDSQKIILSTNPNYNYLYKNTQGQMSSVKNKIIQTTMKARILYVGRQFEDSFDAEAGAQIKVDKHVGEVRVKVNKDGYDFLKGAKRCELDGRIFTISSDERPHGLFSPKYYTFYLKPVD
jgi:hypothetical protein